MAPDPELLRLIESLALKVRNLKDTANPEAASATLCIKAITYAVEHDLPMFGLEPWHVVRKDAPLASPGEMLLRLKDKEGNAIPPYPCVMAFYNNDLTAEFDTVLVLCALKQFMASSETAVSINISGRSLRDPAFIKIILPKIEALNLPVHRKIIFEIHESGPAEIMSAKVLSLCRKLGIAFAIDDVGLSMSDIFRLSEFEGIADFVKLDRKSVRTHPENKHSLDHVMTLINATLPGACIVAEGVQNADHAATLMMFHPGIHYVQGLHLPSREVFAKEWAALSVRNGTV